MAAARESLLEAAGAALAARAWPAVRMVEVAAAAGVSRQTLYNEFGGKAGLGRALVRREADWYLTGVDRALEASPDTAERLAGVAEWTVRAARARPLVRALLTGSWNAGLPAPPGRGVRPGSPALGPGELVRAVRDRAAAALPAEPAQRCELVVRLALSYVVAPTGPGEEAAAGGLLGLVSAPNRTAGAR
ncbi:TetR family transcriptional regulator [Streptomyces cirratus]|uniref:TetR family transcriptional regulator n=1 Tax=Streptomyces cirratus TaxID=68187 RepID=A0ABQ3ESA5_9ACTN|nr:TetR/AcrR family transcriptional regulator [Streptomyces cirratus]GHB47541.1 TetR family transcriptional regulator [Streptomyces cirratus]